MLHLEERIDQGRGQTPVDLVVENARLVNVLSGEIHETRLAVAGGVVVGLGEEYESRHVLDARGRYLCPGLVEGHIHIESTTLCPPEFCRAVAARGTAAVVCDPHEIANVLGVDGVEYVLASTQGLPVAVYVMVPSCVPATHLETSGADMGPDDVAALMRRHPDRVPGLAEMMNFPGVLFKDPGVLAKLRAARGRIVDGHAPLLGGRDLSAYILAGPDSDHETTRLDEAREKLRKGMHLMLREGSHEHNMLELLPVINEFNAQNVSLVSDDRHPGDLAAKGHLDHNVRLAIGAGVPPVRAVQMVSINTARRFGLRGHGALAPGYRADFFLVDDLERFEPSDVHLGGIPLEELDFSSSVPPPSPRTRVRAPRPGDFRVPAGPTGADLVVIGIVPGQILTQKRILPPSLENGMAVADASRDLAKLAVIERHRGAGHPDGGNRGLGFVHGLGLTRGAVASTVAHDSHNCIVAGMDDADMALAASRAMGGGGGFCAVLDADVLACLPLPVAGLMSERPLAEVLEGFHALSRACVSLGRDDSAGQGDLFMILSFLALPVIPSLKLTDKGLVDVDRFAFTDLWTG